MNYRRIRQSSGRFLLLAGIAMTAGCGTMENGHKWGRDAIYPVQWERIPRAAGRALLDPATWIPLAGAAVFTIDDFDEKTSEWASERTPLFGSQATARDFSDYLRGALLVETFATAAFTPSGEQSWEWALAKAKGVLVESGALLATDQTTKLIKGETDRVRPDGSDNKSLPSGHASGAFAGARLANRNLDAMEMKPWLRRTLQGGNFALAGAAAWARVEGEKHYPTDVLVGAALGNFISTFVHDAFLNLPEDAPMPLRIEPSTRGVMVSWTWTF